MFQPSRRIKTWQTILGIIIIIGFVLLLSIITRLIDTDNEPPPQNTTNTSPLRPSPIPKSSFILSSPTAVSSYPQDKVWTTQELVDCNTTTLNEQLSSNDRNSLLSECEVAYYLAELALIAELDERPRNGDFMIRVHVDNVDAIGDSIREISEDRVFDKSEVEFICFALPQWQAHIKNATDYIATDSNPQRLQALEVSMVKISEPITAAEKLCVITPTPISIKPTKAKEKPNITPGMTDDEIYKELRKAPCFLGRVKTISGSWAYQWDTECQMND